MSPAGDRQIPRLARGCRMGKESVLLMPEGILKLSETGLKIISLCDGQRTVGDIIEEIQAGYAPELHERIREDVIAYLARLAQKKAVELTTGSE